jgi:phage portal protein BeeE
VNLLQSLFRRSDATTQRYDGADYAGFDPLDFSFSFGGTTYTGMPGQAGAQAERIESNFMGMVQGAYKRNGIIFACMRARLGVFSDGRFQYQRLRNGRPGDLFGDQSLSLLETPWPNGTTGDLLTRMLQDADLAGNAFFCIRNGHLRRMRPDWVTIVMGSQSDPDILPDDLDAELLGYGYFPGGYMSTRDPIFLLPDDVAHFAPTPDPIAHYRGMSWLTPVIREIQADTAATIHKLAFFENGATLQTIVSFKDMKQEKFEAFQKQMDLAHKGAQNAYKTLYLGGGADATVVGADLKQLDFKVTQGAGETRIAAAAGVHPVIVGLSEGLAGSSLNAGNFGQARRLFSEGTLNTLWRNVSASLQTLVPPPQGAQLVIDKRDIPFLREDAKDAVEIQQNMASTIVSLATGGFTRDSAIAAVVAQDMTLLVEDPNWVSVQLQASAGPTPAGGTPAPATPPAVSPPKARAALAARAFNPDEPRDPLTGEWGHGIAKDIEKASKALEGQDALDAAPAKLTRAPGGHHGDYTGEKLSGPKGIGSARALSEYQGLEYGTTNGILRHPGSDAEKTDWGKKTLARIADIDKTMAASPLEHDVQVHRIVQHGSATFGRDAWYGHVIDWNSNDFDKQDREAENWEAGARPDLTGLRWSDAAYSSTTADPKAAEAFGGRWRSSNSAIDGEPVIMSIHVPAGTGGVQLSEMGHEAEILLERGLTMEVVADHGVGPDGFRRLDVKVVPVG